MDQCLHTADCGTIVDKCAISQTMESQLQERARVQRQSRLIFNDNLSRKVLLAIKQQLRQAKSGLFSGRFQQCLVFH